MMNMPGLVPHASLEGCLQVTLVKQRGQSSEKIVGWRGYCLMNVSVYKGFKGGSCMETHEKLSYAHVND